MTYDITATLSLEDDDDIGEGDEGEGEGFEPEHDGFIPTIDSGPSLERGAQYIGYTDRGPRDVVLSGPVLGGWGPGRYHRSRRVAYDYLVGTWGEARVKPMPQSSGRWSFLVKNLKEEA